MWFGGILFTSFVNRLHHVNTFHQPSNLIELAASITSKIDVDDIEHDESFTYFMNIVGATGLQEEEVPVVMDVVSTVCSEFGIAFSYEDKDEKRDFPVSVITSESAQLGEIQGPTGRVLLLNLINNSDTTYEDESNYDVIIPSIQSMISEHLDQHLYNPTNLILKQPILIAIQTEQQQQHEEVSGSSMSILLGNIVKKDIEQYELCKPLVVDDEDKHEKTELLVPDIHVEIDGAMIKNDPDDLEEEEKFDTSSIFVFDGLVDDNLRESLLNVVNGKFDKDGDKIKKWDDISDGPDPKRWIFGGLDDIPDDIENDETESSDSTASCWGLSEEGINDICYGKHDAISKFEKKLVDLFGSDYIVTRLPEAVYGGTISQITANAPTSQDTFSYHIDADPNTAPPSIWTDIYGRYFNRSPGKPRFMSCLIYLNDSWLDSFGAPTQFKDPPTGETFEINTKPGRVVIMDQDIMHTVVAPNGEEAGKLRPRYSVVWKLVIHPRTEKQDMKDLFSKKASSGKIIRVGSANR